MNRRISTLIAAALIALTSCFYSETPRNNPFDPEGIEYGANGTWAMTSFRGFTGDERYETMTFDKAGAVYFAGSTTGPLDGETITGGPTNALLVKFSENGTWQWTRIRGGSGNVHPFCAISDRMGNIYIAGQTSAVMDGEPFGGIMDLFLIKFNSAGAWQWTRVRGGAGEDSGYGAVITPDDSIYVVGTTSAAFDGQSFNGGTKDAFICKFDLQGNWIWTRLCGGAGNERGYSVDHDSANNIFLCGYTGVSFDGQPFGGGTQDPYVCKYNSTGTRLWTRMAGGTGDDSGLGLAVDGKDNVYICGYAGDTFDGQPFAGGTKDIFVIKYDNSGNKQWTRIRGEGNTESVNRMAIDARGRIYIGGDTTGIFDGQPYGGGTRDAMVCAYDVNGNWLWTRLRGAAGNEYGQHVGLDKAGRVYIVGGTTIGFDGQTLGGGAQDAYFVKFK